MAKQSSYAASRTSRRGKEPASPLEPASSPSGSGPLSLWFRIRCRGQGSHRAGVSAGRCHAGYRWPFPALLHACPRRLAPSACPPQPSHLFSVIGSRSIDEARMGAGPRTTHYGGRTWAGDRLAPRKGLGSGASAPRGWEWGGGCWRGKGHQGTTLGQSGVSKPCLPSSSLFSPFTQKRSAGLQSPAPGDRGAQAGSGFSTRRLTSGCRA